MASLKSEAKKGRKAPEGLPPTRTEVPRETMAEVVKTFSARVADYVAVSALEDPKVSLRMAETIVHAEIHELALMDELERTGMLSEDKHRVLGGIRSNLLRLRKAMGVMQPRKKKAAGFLGGGA